MDAQLPEEKQFVGIANKCVEFPSSNYNSFFLVQFEDVDSIPKLLKRVKK